MATSAFDIIARSLRVLGVLSAHNTPDAQETNDAFDSLNMMLEEWSLEDLMCYQNTANLFTTVASTPSYTIGTGGTWVTGGRPIEVTNAFIRVSDIDHKVEIIENDEYQKIVSKATESMPGYLYYQPEYPLGKIYLYPTPDDAYSISISQLLKFSSFATTAATVSLPPGYLKALIWNLAVELAPEYGREISQITAKKAIESKANIKRKNNIQPELKLESSMLGRTGSFDISSGSYL